VDYSYTKYTSVKSIRINFLSTPTLMELTCPPRRPYVSEVREVSQSLFHLTAVEWPLLEVQRSVAWQTRNGRFRQRAVNGAQKPDRLLSASSSPTAAAFAPLQPCCSTAAPTAHQRPHPRQPSSRRLPKPHCPQGKAPLSGRLELPMAGLIKRKLFESTSP
jgi:hypothetical protein